MYIYIKRDLIKALTRCKYLRGYTISASGVFSFRFSGIVSSKEELILTIHINVSCGFIIVPYYVFRTLPQSSNDDKIIV